MVRARSVLCGRVCVGFSLQEVPTTTTVPQARVISSTMPIYVLYMKAELEGVAKFWVPPETDWNFDVKQGSSAEERKGIAVDPDEEQDVPDTKNTTAHFMLKFEGAKHFSYLKVLKPGGEGFPKDLTLRAQTADDTAMVPIFACECRGLEPTKWTPIGPYSVEATSGTVYNEVGFRENEDWCEYDEKSEESMTVGLEIQSEFRLHKK